MPMTMKYFRFPVDSGVGATLSMDSCVAFADASSISRFDIVLSSVLQITDRVSYPKSNIYVLMPRND
jgi:hypothetical protein